MDNRGVTVYAPDLQRTYEPARADWFLPSGKKLAVSILMHAPAYMDNVPEGALKPLEMQGGVGRDTSEPRIGQVVRLSQWDFGLTVGIFRLMSIAEAVGVPFAVTLDQYGVEHAPGLAGEVGRRAPEIVARGRAANLVFSEEISPEKELITIRECLGTIREATGRTPAGWFSPERATSSRTHALLAQAGISWFGEWPVDETPVVVPTEPSEVVSLPFSLEAEDMFALYTRGMRFDDYEQFLKDTVQQLLEDADIVGSRFLGLSWFGWVLGQACFADVAERFLAWLVEQPEVEILLPSEVAPLAGRAVSADSAGGV